MAINEKIKKHLSKLTSYLFNYREGYFEFNYLAQSPQDMIDGFDATLFIKHKRDIGYMSSKTPFMNADMIYHKLEDGLWVCLSSAVYKANVNYKRIVDKNIPSDYYFLALEVSQRRIKKNDQLVNGLTYENTSWLLFKPEVLNSSCHKKHVIHKSLTIFFNDEFLQNKLLKDPVLAKSGLKTFFTSNQKSLISPESDRVGREITSDINEMMHGKKEGIPPDEEKLSPLVMNLFRKFAEKLHSMNIELSGEISDNSRKKMLEAENFLINNIDKPFVGLDELSEKIGISISMLKSDFKTLYGKPVYQYFRSKQMQYARHVLSSGNLSVKDLGIKLGYQSPSKFTSAFKKEFEILPSEVEVVQKEK
ncbi:MAG: helix-turn-helix transcriptional regulator [Cyclobacteriaceae bacterium]